jgi:hypothetical protein
MTSGQEPEKREAIPTKEPFDVWWPKYLAQVRESAEAAERHLEVPAGTIWSIPTEPDFIATVKAYAVIEPILNELIAHRPPQPPWGNLLGLTSMPSMQIAKDNFRTFVTGLNVSGRSGKLRLAEGLGLLTQNQINFVEAVVRVRNRYAHNVKNMHRPLSEILAEEQPHQGRIVEHLTGIKMPLPLPMGLDRDILRWFMYHRLADYLASALHTLRPPPPPEGGILSGLFKAAENAPSAGRVDAEK